MALALTHGTIETWHKDNFFEIKKSKKPRANTWHDYSRML